MALISASLRHDEQEVNSYEMPKGVEHYVLGVKTAVARA